MARTAVSEKKASVASKYVTVAPGVELHYLEAGKGQPMILIPGLTFGGEIFEHQIEHFSKAYRVLAVDPRGQGLSTKNVDGNDYLTHGKDISVFIKKLRLKDVILAGWSTGNLDCWSYLKQFGSDKVKALITIDMSPLPLSEDPAWWTEGTKEELSQCATEILTTPEGMRAFFKDYAEQIMLQNPTAEQVTKVLDNSAKTPYWIGHQLFCDAIFSNYLEIARNPGVPALMFIAEHWSDVAEGFMKKQMPEIKRYVMGGHLMFFEYYEKWNEVVEEFLNGI